MWQGLALTIFIGLLWGAVGVLYSRLAVRRVPFGPFMLLAYLLTCPVAWAVVPDYAAWLGGRSWRFWTLAAVMTPSGAALMGGMVLLQQAMRRGHQGASWTISQSAMVWPFAVSVLFLGSPLRATGVVGMVLLLGALACFGRARGQSRPTGPGGAGPSWLLFALGAMCLLGTQQALNILPSYWTGWADVARLRLPLLLTAALGGYVVLALVQRQGICWRHWRLALGFMGLSIVSSQLLYRAVDVMAPRGLGGVVYPLAVGVCILSFALYSLLKLREHATASYWAGLAMGLLGVTALCL